MDKDTLMIFLYILAIIGQIRFIMWTMQDLIKRYKKWKENHNKSDIGGI